MVPTSYLKFIEAMIKNDDDGIPEQYYCDKERLRMFWAIQDLIYHLYVYYMLNPCNCVLYTHNICIHFPDVEEFLNNGKDLFSVFSNKINDYQSVNRSIPVKFISVCNIGQKTSHSF